MCVYESAPSEVYNVISCTSCPMQYHCSWQNNNNGMKEAIMSKTKEAIDYLFEYIKQIN